MSPEHDEAVRRLLADARHDEPMPADVVARLDAVLAGLSSERATAAPGGEPPRALPAPVTDLAARRRRRVRAWLLAAAAVVVIGAAGPSALRSVTGAGGESETSGAASESQADRGAGGDTGGSTLRGSQDADTSRVPAPATEPDDTPAPQRAQARARQLAHAYAVAGAPVVRADHFAADVRRLQHGSQADSLTAQPTAPFACAPADWGPGRLVPVTYQGAPAVLALRPWQGAIRVADLLRCGTGEVLRSVTLTAP